jgi:phosphatidylglycerol---prolipoprotein diacylglyceryl transferase
MNQQCGLFLQYLKLLRGLGHFVSLHPTGRLKGGSTPTTSSVAFYTIGRGVAPFGFPSVPPHSHGGPSATRLPSPLNDVILFRVIPFLHIGSFAIPTFGLMVACSMIAAYFVLRADLVRRGIASKDSGEAEALISFPCLAGFVGAKLYHLLESAAEFFADPLHLLFSPYGFAWFGGLLAGFATFAFVAWRITRHNATVGHPVSLLTIFDAGSPAAALGYGIGRIGCLLSGDGDYGIPTSLPWGMSFPNGLVPTVERVHPTPLYEFIAACAIAGCLWKLGAPDHAGVGETEPAAQDAVPAASSRRPGEVFAAYLVLTGLARFLVEFIRINPRTFLGMSNAQTAAALSIIVGAFLWIWVRRKT